MIALPRARTMSLMKLRIAMTIAAGALVLLVAVLGNAVGHRFAADAAPDATLVDQNGQPFRLSDQGGKELVLFFGYAHCTDVCPETMQKLASAYHDLGSSASRVRVAFKTPDDYEMGHTSGIYLLDPRGRLRSIHDYTDSSAQIAAAMRSLL